MKAVWYLFFWDAGNLVLDTCKVFETSGAIYNCNDTKVALSVINERVTEVFGPYHSAGCAAETKRPVVTVDLAVIGVSEGNPLDDEGLIYLKELVGMSMAVKRGAKPPDSQSFLRCTGAHVAPPQMGLTYDLLDNANAQHEPNSVVVVTVEEKRIITRKGSEKADVASARAFGDVRASRVRRREKPTESFEDLMADLVEAFFKIYVVALGTRLNIEVNDLPAEPIQPLLHACTKNMVARRLHRAIFPSTELSLMNRMSQLSPSLRESQRNRGE
ncbi:hypothetical protein DEU56DRAFT_762586 [Suillus clintonianus]|uniref:uncharacterized protein n=1 Tax=Suillus clintonianus TaxID=1904413 RepID=UPI001B863149|nr:uncharacterized protein DEU56DRAFT_762586 [Suillus clintonianus]KAG2107812.1 hypothetical protein DEU56DRAFT_762586 [Suillus clintonianus]